MARNPNETKRDKFIRLANSRAYVIVVAAERLGKLGTSAYERNADDVVKLRKALIDAINAACDALEPRSADKGRRQREPVL